MSWLICCIRKRRLYSRRSKVESSRVWAAIKIPSFDFILSTIYFGISTNTTLDFILSTLD